MKHQNFWAANSKGQTLDINLELPEKLDVAIIGGGIAGLACAYELTIKSDLKVALFEESYIGYKTSGRSIGRIGIPNSDRALQIKAWHGQQKLREYRKLIQKNTEYLTSVIARENIDCDLQKNGSFVVANNASLLEGLATSEDKLFLAQELSELLPSDRFSCGVYNSQDLLVNPNKLLQGLAKAINTLQQVIFTNAYVEKIVTKNDEHILNIKNRGQVKATAVIYCDGASSKNLKSQLYLWRTQALASSLVPNQLLKRFNNICLMHHDKELRIVNNRFLISGENLPTKNLNDELSYNQLLIWLSSVFPCIPKNLTVDMAWSYVNANGKDGFPLVGAIAKNKYVSVGPDFNLAFEAADTIKQLILKQTSQNKQQIFYPLRNMTE